MISIGENPGQTGNATSNEPLFKCVGHTYNVTQTLSKFYHKSNAHKQLFGTLPNIIKVLDNLYSTNYQINTELTTAGNIHYHMQVTSFMNKEQFIEYYTLLTKDLGFSQIIFTITVKQRTAWIEYMTKDVITTVKKLNTLLVITRSGIPKNHSILKTNEYLRKHLEIINKKQLEKVIEIKSNYLSIYGFQEKVPDQETVPEKDTAKVRRWIEALEQRD